MVGAERHHARRTLERGLGGGLVAAREVEQAIAADVVVQLRRDRREGLSGAGHDQRLTQTRPVI